MLDDLADWRACYREKLVDARTAARRVRRGQRLFIGSGAAEPQALVQALTERSPELADTEIVHIMTLGVAPYAEEKFAGAFRHNAFFIGPNVRSAVDAGRADYTPVFLSEIPKLFRSGHMPLDFALIQVSPPDERGICTYGVSVDVVKAAAESARIVIAEVNPRMPRTLGDSEISVDRFACLVENDTPLLEAVPAAPDDVAMAIGQNVARLIASGSTLQIGIGMLPNAVLRCLGDKRDLGVHTEMFSDGLIDLIESGVVNGAKKTMLQGKVVSSFCMGTRRLYDFVDNNPVFDFHPVEFTNDPFVIAGNRQMVAINGALEVDLTGQVCADSIGSHFYSGIGGQVDFIRGSARSEGGKPIIVLRSTATGGTISRIVPRLREGAGVVTTRGDVHFVVTEYGVADLWGKSVRERVLALIAIAHPNFRAELMEEAKRRNLVYQDQLLPPADSYPAQLETEATMRDGTRILFRPVRPADESLMRELFYACSEESIYHRFFACVKRAPHERLQRFVNVDYAKEIVMVATIVESGRERIVAGGQYALNADGKTAEVAFLVADEYQGRGIGTFLLATLMKLAAGHGITGLTADVLADNREMLEVFHRSGCEVKTRFADGVYHVVLEFPAG